MLATHLFGRHSPPFSGAGGTESTVGGYKYHTFLIAQSGNTFVSSNDTGIVEILLVGGGGQAGSGTSGGGGAGGLIYISNFQMPVGTYTVTVGAGGSGSTVGVGDAGSNSVITDSTRTLTAIGGGGGGGHEQPSTYLPATDGGGSAGGHAGYQSSQSNLNTAETPTSPFTAAGGNITTGGVTYSNVAFGNNGGIQYQSANGGAPGGGGAGGIGNNGSAYDTNTGGQGGVGKAIASFNHTVWGGSSNTYYAAGGNGSNLDNINYSASGIGGVAPQSATDNAPDPGQTLASDRIGALTNTGSGGGGTWNHGSGIGGDGASGIVMIRYTYN